MAAGGSQGVIPSSNTPTTFFREVQHGIIRSVSTTCIEGLPGPTDTWVVVFLSDTGVDIRNAVLVFYSDYIIREQPLTWTGYYEIQGHERVVTWSRSLVEVTLSTSFTIATKPAY